jgi:hypothetical protein
LYYLAPVSLTYYITKRRSAGYPHSFTKDRRGFALLITITLLAFLVLLLVSLAALTRVETQVAANNQTLAQARQNALMAMNIAIGQLQKYAGRDTQITARAEITSDTAITNPYLTGVWRSDVAGANAEMWLVSGSEGSTATADSVMSSTPDPSQDAVTLDQVFLVGNQTVAADPSAVVASDKVKRIKVAKQDIFAPTGAVLGLASSATPRIGRYAWWVGDQGVKASLGLTDRANEITYLPWFDSSNPTNTDQRRRIRQEIGTGPNYFRADGAATGLSVPKEGFDPFSTPTSGLLTEAQIAIVGPAAPTQMPAGGMARFQREHSYDFTAAAYSVLANTRTDTSRGLMQDLSLSPSLLGSAFASYANYTGYMETPGVNTPGAFDAVPAIADANSPRRRYKITAPVAAAAGTGAGLPTMAFGIHPVLSDLIVQFSVKRSSAANQIEVRSRVYVGLWNPYSSALVPPFSPNTLNLEVEGLPQITVAQAPSTVQVDLGNSGPAPAYSGGVLKALLPFDPLKRAINGYGSTADLASWLPGRKYLWATASGGGTSGELAFYTNDLGAAGWSHTTSGLAGSSANLAVSIPAATLTVKLKLGTTLLATYTMPTTDPASISDVDMIRTRPNGGVGTPSNKHWQFGFAFRLKQPSADDQDRTWIKTFDPRASTLPATAFIPFDPDGALTPSEYPYTIRTTQGVTQYLIYRVQSNGVRALSSYNDVSLFELPRTPLLSVGELQHMEVDGQRPYSVGNSWGGAANIIFDRFFFSGLQAGAGTPDLSKNEPLPNWNMRVVDGTALATIQGAPGAQSSRYLMQAGGFNVNSLSVPAWRAVLSSVRFSDGEPFRRASIDNTSGANGGSQENSDLRDETFNQDATLGSATASVRKSAPSFFRFPQSAQEIYFWQDPQTSSPSGNVRQFKAEAFRRGVRGYNTAVTSPSVTSASQASYTQATGSMTGLDTAAIKGVNIQHLTTDQIEVLANEIVFRIRARTKDFGPFRSMEEFLSPTAPDQPSLLEAAIDGARMNADAVRPVDTVSDEDNYYGLSALTLTQGDIMTALAPYLRTRSDTFTVRTYGEAINPITDQVAAATWLEATVQRMPDLVDSTDTNIAQPSLTGFGRKFKIISFRWLSQKDI